MEEEEQEVKSDSARIRTGFCVLAKCGQAQSSRTLAHEGCYLRSATHERLRADALCGEGGTRRRVGACLGPSARSSRRGRCLKAEAVTVCQHAQKRGLRPVVVRVVRLGW